MDKTQQPLMDSMFCPVRSDELDEFLVDLQGNQEALKYDSGKLPLDLLPFEVLEEIAKVYKYGATKYAPHNWRKGMAWSRLIGATLRHFFAFCRGENKDKESELPHLSHAIFCLMTLLSHHLTQTGTDDRWRVET